MKTRSCGHITTTYGELNQGPQLKGDFTGRTAENSYTMTSGGTVQDEYADTLHLRQDVNAVVLIHHEHRKSGILIPENHAFMNQRHGRSAGIKKLRIGEEVFVKLEPVMQKGITSRSVMAVACYYGIAALVLLILQFLRIAEWQTVLGNNDHYKSKQNVSSNGCLELS
ncbi:hypothetical protein T10_10853 [Trichinella papuae]|uniref:Uncharacterized protein n=1 Tax=Trichinella papuae TaxID=268474 RepID=A0A0V1M0U1_9BILA|nr:hypothetical protein T10_10853 [Trichinella papuae]